MPRIGHLSVGSAVSPLGEAERGFRQGLRDLKYIEGQNLTLEQRYAEGKTERLTELATDLVRIKVDAIVTLGTPTALAAKRATSTIPIVFYASSDPVGAGIVTNLARPGGNITGQSNMAVDLYQKQGEVLKETVSKLSSLAVLWHRDDPAAARGV